MPGSVTFEPTPAPLDTPRRSVGVFRLRSGSYSILPSVRCVQVEEAEGPDPGTARFRYVFRDESQDDAAPYRWDQVWQLSAPGRPGSVGDVVRNDDRLCVIEFDAGGGTHLAFDGYAQVPQLDVSGKQQQVTFQASGTPVRAWDRPFT